MTNLTCACAIIVADSGLRTLGVELTCVAQTESVVVGQTDGSSRIIVSAEVTFGALCIGTWLTAGTVDTLHAFQTLVVPLTCAAFSDGVSLTVEHTDVQLAVEHVKCEELAARRRSTRIVAARHIGWVTNLGAEIFLPTNARTAIKST